MEHTRGDTFSISLLSAYYPIVETLHEHLANSVNGSKTADAFLVHETDTKQYRDLLLSCVVVSHAETAPKSFTPAAPSCPLREVRSSPSVRTCLSNEI